MPRSSSKTPTRKAFKFSAQVELINSGKIRKATKFTVDEVDKIGCPTRKKKDRKNTEARIYEHKIVFKEKLHGGNGKKKRLRFAAIVFVDRPCSDEFKIFLQYEKADKAYFFVLQFSEAGNAKDFIKLVKKANQRATIHRESVTDIEVCRAVSSERTSSLRNGQYRAENYLPHQNGKPPRNTSMYPDKKRKQSIQGFDDTLVYVPVATTFVTSWEKPNHDSGSELKYPKEYAIYTPSRSRLNDAELNRRTGLVTKYTYVGPEDAENSTCEDHVCRIRPPRNANRRTPRQEIKRYPRSHSEHNFPVTNNTNSVRSNRSKSRQLPLSEDERNKTGWHSDITFVSPKPNGDIEVSDDGPVLLYVATRENVQTSSDGEDEDSSFEISSSSSVENEMNSEMYRSYSRSYPMRS